MLWAHMRLSFPNLWLGNIPVVKHRIFRWFPSSGLVSAKTVGAKNMASSSGCAISRQMRLLQRLGRERVKGEAVDESIQKTRTTVIASAIVIQLSDADMMPTR